jgi:hypothetical protein
MHRRVLTVVACALLTVSARPASAQAIQQWIDRGYANVNVAFDSGSGSLDDSVTFRIYNDNGTKVVEADQDSGALFDFSFGARVWRNASVGLGFHRGSTSGEAGVTAVVPSPISFTLPARNAILAVTDLNRTERAIHLQFGYMLPINDKVDVHVLGGPSFFRLSQDVVSDVTIAEVGAPFTAVNATAVITERERSTTGGHIGADVMYKLRDTGNVALGVGGFMRYSGASTTVIVLASEVETDLGGFQIGFGGRMRF